MRLFKQAVAAVGILTIFSSLSAGAWQMKQAPLMTDWAQQVDVNSPLPEYPRPQLVRSNWLNLNGIWQFQAGTASDAVPVNRTLSSEILVPFPMESAISGVKAYHARSWYRRTFTVPASWAGQRLLLHLDAVDWESEVFINGQSVGVHKGGYDPIVYDITSYVVGSGAQELIVRVYDPTDDAGEPRGKQTLNPGGIMYTSCSGIWQPVWLEPVPATSIGGLKLVPDIDSEQLQVSVNVTGPTNGITVNAVARIGTNVVGSVSGAPNTGLSMPVPNPVLWCPTNPFLYDLTVSLQNNGNTGDVVTSYFGMRKISLGTTNGFLKMLLNNEFVFQYGPLDQGFWPDGIYTAPTDHALRSDIEMTKAAGFNMIRKHIKVERQRWYYWADKLGVLVWQDMPSINSYTGNPKPIDAPQYKSELVRMVTNLWSHPSIIMWVVFNEGQGQHDTAALVQEVRNVDPSRLINQASGGEHFGVGDILDWHSYPNPSCPVSTNQSVVCGEFGGVGLGITNHTWAPGWGYISALDGDDLTSKIEAFSWQLCDFVQNRGLSAAVYTEITDVEIELNGFYTYDRKVCKPDLARTRTAILAPSGKYGFTTIVPTSQASGQVWKYTTDAPATNWYVNNFTDTAWKTGNGGFGTSFTPNTTVRTTWNTSDIWLRRTFYLGALTDQQLKDLVMSVHHDEDVEVYINGVLAYSASGYTQSYTQFPITDVGRSALMTNANNTIAVHCHQTTGGQYVDVGLDVRTVLVAPPQPPATPEVIENGSGLRAEYFNGLNLSNLVLERTDSCIDFNWGTRSPASGISNELFSVRWTGWVQPRYSEVYTFHLTADDGCRLWINNELLIDKWRNDGGTDVARSIELTGGQKYAIKIEYYENTVDASAKLEWNSASQSREVVPTGVLFSGGEFEKPSASNLPPTPVFTNRAPLVATPFSALPLGSVRPRGWLLTQCELQRDGLTGNAEAIYAQDLGPNSGWLGGTGEGWERGPYYYKGLISLAYVLNDPSLKLKAQKWMDWLLDHQRPDGNIGPSSNNDWWPRMVATYALRDYYEATGDVRVPTVLSNYFGYMMANLPGRPLTDWGKARAGDQMDVALWLYNRNGDGKLLSLVNLLRQQAYDWSGILTSNNFMLYGSDFHPKHNVNVEQALKLPAVYYQVSKKAVDRDALSLGLQHLMREHGSSCGLNHGTEFLSGNSSIQGVELCSSVEAMLSLETAVRITGEVALADRLETISFNALPAGLANNIKGLQYYTLPNNVIAVHGAHGFNQDYANGTLPGPNSGFPCCCYNFHMGWPKFIQNSWAATPDGGLAAIAYGPTVVNALAGGQQVQITEETGYPFEDQVRLRISVSNVVTFPLVLRIPGWCSNATVRVNGQIQPDAMAGSFYRMQRAWTNGDLVTLKLPMPIQTQTGPSRAVAINRGPLVYSLRIGENWTVRTSDPLGRGFNEYEVRSTTPWAYALQLDLANPAASFTFSASSTPPNPFDPAQPSVSLVANARRISGWTNGWRGTHAFEPPTSPVSSANSMETVTLVPFGFQHMRLSWFPYLGAKVRSNSLAENFDSTWSQRWTVFGGNWLARDGALSTMPHSAHGAKALATGAEFKNFTYEGDVVVGGTGNAGLIFRASKADIGADAYCGYYVGINPQGSMLEFGCASNSWRSITNIPMTFVKNKAYHLKIQALGSRLRVFVTDTNQPVLDIQDSTFSGGMIGVRNYCPDENQSMSSFSNLRASEFESSSGEVPHAWYPFEGNAEDASGNENNGAVSSNVAFPSGKLGAKAAQFSGSSDSYVTIPRSVSDSFTIAFWVKTTATGGSGGWFNGKGLVDGEVANTQDDFGISLIGSKVAFGVGNPDTTIYSTNTINNGAWHHVAVTRDSGSGQMRIYVDGVLETSANGPSGPKNAPPNLRIGSLQTGASAGFLSGAIDDVQIFDHVCSAQEVASLMNHAPSLMPIFDASVRAGATLSVPNSATDPDLPAQMLTYSLQNPPAGATIHPASGVVTWRPTLGQAGSQYPLAVRVADNGTPSMVDTQSFSVSVSRPVAPNLVAPSFRSGAFQMTVSGDSGPDYSVYVSTNLAFSNWALLAMATQAVTPFLFIDPAASNSAQRFYRVVLGP